MIFSANMLWAVVADPKPIDVRQSDGTTLTIKLGGDERLHWVSTLDEYTLMRNSNNDYVYAVRSKDGGIAPSDILAHNPQSRTQEELAFLSSVSKRLFYSEEQLSLVRQYNAARFDFENKVASSASTSDGPQEYKMLVVLMSFADRAFTTPRADVEALFNQTGYSTNGNAGSVNDYFLASTNNHLSVKATVVGPYTAVNNLSYYGEDGTYTWQGTEYPAIDVNVRDLVREAIYAAADDVDFTQFTNGTENNEVECVYILYAGYAQSSGNADYTIWPHRSSLGTRLFIDNVSFYNYGCSSEIGGYEGYSSDPLMIGTIVHEFSHVLGLPDMYDTEYQNGYHSTESFHPGTWDVMAQGSYNGSSGYPPVWSGLERNFRGYSDIVTLTEPGSYTLPPLDQESKIFKITSADGEYFLLENKQKRSFDSYIPGHGMLIYHVDESAWNLSGNCVNCQPGHEGYRVVCSGTSRNATNPFPGSDNKTSFGDNTTPNSITYTGQNTNKPIYNITENTATGNVNFVFMDQNNFPYITNSNYDFKSDTLNFGAKIASNNSGITEKGVCYSLTESVPTTADNSVVATTAGDSINVDLSGLNPNTYYYVRAYAKKTTYTGYGETIKIKTPCNAITNYPYEFSFEDSDEDLTCLNQDPTIESNKWQIVDSLSFYTNGAYEGEKFAYIKSDFTSNPPHSVKLLIRPLDIRNLSQPMLSFAYEQKVVSYLNKDILKIYYKNTYNGEWTLLKQYNAGTTSWTTDSINLPTGHNFIYLAFEGAVKSAGGVYLDNIVVKDRNLASYPVVQTMEPTNIGDNSVTLNASCSSSGNGPLTEKGFVVSTEPNPTMNDIVLQSTDLTTGVYNISMDTLTSSTQYYVRAFARNQALLSYGEQKTFTTLCDRVRTLPYEPQLNSEDTLCFGNEGIWYVDQSDNSYTYTVVQSGQEQKKLVTPLISLAYMTNIGLQFDCKSTNANGANLNVLVKNDVNASWQQLASINLGTINSYQTQTQSISESIGVGERTLIAFQIVGAQGSKVNIRNIKISAVSQIPSVSTDSVRLADYNEIKVYASIHENGLSPISAKGVCYSTSDNPTIEDNVVNVTGSTDNYFADISNLQIMTQYYVRAFATNSYGTAYGEVLPISTTYYTIHNNTIHSDQRVCASYPAQILGDNPTGGDGEFSYLWIKSTDLQTWEPCNEDVTNTGKNYQPRPEVLSGVYYYARVVTSGYSVDTSAYVTITIDKMTQSGNIFPANINNAEVNDTITLQLRAYLGDIVNWQVRQPSLFSDEWEAVPQSENSANLTYVFTSGGKWAFRAMVQNGSCPIVESPEKIIEVSGVGLLDATKTEVEMYLTPNPSDGNVTLVCNNDINRNVTVTITNMSGAVVHVQKMVLRQGENKLDLSFMQAGTYLIGVKGDQLSWQSKLIVTPQK